MHFSFFVMLKDLISLISKICFFVYFNIERFLAESNIIFAKAFSILDICGVEETSLYILIVFFFSLFLGIIFSKLLVAKSWFLSVLKLLSNNLWVYFLAAFPFYFWRSFSIMLSQSPSFFFDILFFIFTSFLFILLIISFYIKRGSNDLYKWLIFNTKIRVSLVSFILLSICCFCVWGENTSDLQFLLSRDLLVYLEKVNLLSEFPICLLLVETFLFMVIYFLSSFVYLIDLISTLPLLVIVSNFLVSGILLRGFFLYPFLLDFFNGIILAEKNGESYKLMFKAFNVKTTLPELWGKNVVAKEKFRSRYFHILSKQALQETKVSWLEYPKNLIKSYHNLSNGGLSDLQTFLKQQKPFSHWKNFLPFSAIEQKILKLSETATTVQHKLLVMYYVFESERSSSKSSHEVLSSVCLDLGLYSGSESEILAKLNVYGVNNSSLSALSEADLNLVDLANMKELYLCVKNLNSYYSPQHLALTANYLSETCRSSFFRSQGIFDKLTLTTDFRTQQLQLVSEVLFQFLRYFSASSQILDHAQQAWKSSEAQAAIIRAGRHLRAEFSSLEQKGIAVEFLRAVEGNYLGDYKLCLTTGEQRYLDVTQVSGTASVRIVENPHDADLDDVEKVVKSTWKVALEKSIHNELNVFTSVHHPLLVLEGEELEFLLGKTEAEFKSVYAKLTDDLKEKISRSEKKIKQLPPGKMQDQIVVNVEKLKKQKAILGGLSFNEVLARTSVTTSGTFKK